MKKSKNEIIFDIIVLTLLALGLLWYLGTEFVISHYDLTMAPIKTGNIPFLFVALIGGCLAWCIDKLIFKIRLLAGKDQGNVNKENKVVRYLGRFFERYL